MKSWVKHMPTKNHRGRRGLKSFINGEGNPQIQYEIKRELQRRNKKRHGKTR